MNEHHEIRKGNEPSRFSERNENIILYIFTEGPVAGNGDGNITPGNNSIGNKNTQPHGFL